MFNPKKNIMEQELRMLSVWLKSADKYDFGYDSTYSGILEEKIAQSQQEVCHKIGEYIEEILEMKKKDTRDCI